MKTINILFLSFLLLSCGGGSSESPLLDPPVIVETPVEEPELPEEPEEVFEPNVVGTHCNPFYREIIEKVVGTMDLPMEAVNKTWVYCNHYTPGYRDRVWKSWRNPSNCDQTSWFALIGCAQGWTFDGVSTEGSNVGVLYIPPLEMDILIAEAKSAGLKNERPWNDIRCLWGPERFAFLLAHEFNHAWNGFHHADAIAANAMAEADAIVRDQIREEHGEFLSGIQIEGCPQQRNVPDDDIFIEMLYDHTTVPLDANVSSPVSTAFTSPFK